MTGSGYRSANQRVGKQGEDLAAAEAVRRGYRVLTRNLRTPFGEIDLVLESDAAFVFAEVKTRRSIRFGLPEDAVTPAKLARMRCCAAYVFNDLDNPARKPFRLDVIALLRSPDDPAGYTLRWIENVTEDD